MFSAMPKDLKTQAVRVAVIGAGRWGTRIIQTLKTFSLCEVAYVEARDYRTLIHKKDIDAVLVATPGATHAQVALPFIKKGLSVFIEKPLTTCVKDAQLLKRAAEKSGSLVFIGHIQLYNGAFCAAKELSAKIGRIRFMTSEGSNNGPYRDDMSAIWDWAPHGISMMLDILGVKPTTVEAWGVSTLRPETALHDVGYIKLNFPKGVTGFVFTSWLFPEKRKKLTIVGEKSTIVFDDMAEKKVTLYEDMGPDVEEKSVIQKEPRVSYPSYDVVSPLTRELKAFLEMVRTRAKPRTDIDNGIAAVSILEAAEKSIKRTFRARAMLS